MDRSIHITSVTAQVCSDKGLTSWDKLFLAASRNI